MNQQIATETTQRVSSSRNVSKLSIDKKDDSTISLNDVEDSDVKSNDDTIDDFEEYAPSLHDQADEVKISARSAKTGISDFCMTFEL